MNNLNIPITHRWFCRVRSHRCCVFSPFFLFLLCISSSLHKLLGSGGRVLLLLALMTLPLQAQLAQVLPQRALSKWKVPAGNYSGITPLGNKRFAVVSDKAPSLGYFEWEILQDSLTGQVTHVSALGFRPLQSREKQPEGALDVEDLVFDAQRGAVWIANEGDQTLTAYDTATQQRAATMDIPPYFSRDSIFANLGFEALAHDARTQLWCSTSESPLRGDAPARPEQLLPKMPLNVRLTFWDNTFTARALSHGNFATFATSTLLSARGASSLFFAQWVFARDGARTLSASHLLGREMPHSFAMDGCQNPAAVGSEYRKSQLRCKEHYYIAYRHAMDCTCASDSSGRDCRMAHPIRHL